MPSIVRCPLAAPALALALLTAAPVRAERPIAVDLELVLAIDVSGSVDSVEARLQRDGYVQALIDPEVVRAVRSGILGKIAVTYVEWAGVGHQSMIVGWSLIEDRASAEAFSSRIAGSPFGPGRFTSISGAIDYAAPLFRNNGYEGTRRVIDVSGDGPNNVGRIVTAARDEAVAQGITINGLPIVNDRLDRWGPQLPNLDLYYKDCVIGGPGAFYVVAKSFKDFALAVRRKLILEIAGRMPDAPAAPRWGRLPRPAGADPLVYVADEAAARDCLAGERFMRRRFRDSDFNN